MNQGVLLGFTRVRAIPAGESYPQMKVKYVHDTAYTITASDLDTVLITTNGSATTLTIPSWIGLKNGSAIHFAQQGAGQITVAAGAGVTLRTASTAKTRAQYSVISIMRMDPNNDQGEQWYLFGDME